jgi:predicted alpha/beta hydrolase family esterase
MATASAVLTLPGWQNSGPAHWQTRWEALHGDRRVEQSDWLWPRRGDWMARLDEVLQAESHRPTLLAAHSLGCHLVAAWAAHTRHADRVRGALLVAPPDTGRADLPPQLHSWRPPVRRLLPFPAILLYSEDDPYGSPEHALQLARQWGASAFSLGAAGHVNADSGLGDWPAGRAQLLAASSQPRPGR